jgi:hypothetical protein
MNLTPDITELPPPSIGEAAAPAPEPTGSKHPPLKIIGIAVAVLAGVGLIAVISDKDAEPTTARAASTADAGTGDATVDEQIVDAVWAQNKGEICPSFNELKATMPSMSDEEILDMGMGMADMSALTPAQIAHLRELALTDC